MGVQIPRHILSVDQFDRAFLDYLCAVTTRLREASRTKKGAHWLRRRFPYKRGMLYFTQPSSRTYTSFLSAMQNLGMMTTEVRDPSMSSEKKGETPLDSLRTFSSYADVIVVRSPIGGLVAKAAEYLDTTPRPVPIINAGSGADEHPTQALLDIYTLERSFRKHGGIGGKTLVLVGDLARGRTVRSLAKLMRHYPHTRLILVSPPEFRMRKDIRSFLGKHNIPFEETTDFNAAVRAADAVYMTRIQDEHDGTNGASAKVDIRRFCFKPKHLKMLGPHSIVMHPLPRRQELDPACDKDPRVMIWRQERNGMWVRTALIYLMLQALKDRDPVPELF